MVNVTFNGHSCIKVLKACSVFLPQLSHRLSPPCIARSPLYSHISTTIQGLPTIRSYKMESMAMKQFHQYQNEHTQGSHLYNACARWFSVRVDLLIVGVLATMAFSSIPLASCKCDLVYLCTSPSHFLSLQFLLPHTGV